MIWPISISISISSHPRPHSHLHPHSHSHLHPHPHPHPHPCLSPSLPIPNHIPTSQLHLHPHPPLPLRCIGDGTKEDEDEDESVPENMNSLRRGCKAILSLTRILKSGRVVLNEVINDNAITSTTITFHHHPLPSSPSPSPSPSSSPFNIAITYHPSPPSSPITIIRPIPIIPIWYWFQVDTVITASGHVHHLRDVIFESRRRWETARETAGQNESELDKCVEYLKRYAYIVCLNSYL